MGRENGQTTPGNVAELEFAGYVVGIDAKGLSKEAEVKLRERHFSIPFGE
ncbi:MAG: hypothetical protein ABSD38_38370 [Syntrophorhabdales bacterium]|jgi:hypothetical protein